MHQQKTLLLLVQHHYAGRTFTLREVQALIRRLGIGPLRGKEQATLSELAKKTPALQHVRYGVYRWQNTP